MPGNVLNREAIYAATFALLNRIAGWQFTDRKWHAWDQNPPGTTPALLMIGGPESRQPRDKLPTIVMVGMRAIMYFTNNQGRDVSPDTQINTALDALDQSLVIRAPETRVAGARFVPDLGSTVTTLGGLVAGLRVDSAHRVQGLAGSSAMCIVELTAFTTT